MGYNGYHIIQLGTRRLREAATIVCQVGDQYALIIAIAREQLIAAHDEITRKHIINARSVVKLDFKTLCLSIGQNGL